MAPKILPVAFLLILTLLPAAAAQISGHGQSSQDCSQETLIGLLGVTSAGNVESCTYYPTQVGTATSTFAAGVILTAPAATGAGTATMTTNWVATSGCTLTGAATNGGPGGTGFGTQFYSLQRLTMTSNECEFTVGVTYKNGAGTTLFSAAYPAQVLAKTGPTYLDALDRGCAASASGTACTTPTVNAVNSGSVVPDYLARAGFALTIGLLFAIAVACSFARDPAANFFGIIPAALAGFRAFDTSAGLTITGTVLLGSFLLVAWCLIVGAMRIQAGAPLWPVREQPRDDTEL